MENKSDTGKVWGDVLKVWGDTVIQNQLASLDCGIILRRETKKLSIC